MTVRRRRLLAIAVDATLVSLAYYLALTFRFEGRIPHRLGLGGTFPLFLVLAIAAHL